jgi:hypothetical protein
MQHALRWKDGHLGEDSRCFSPNQEARLSIRLPWLRNLGNSCQVLKLTAETVGLPFGFHARGISRRHRMIVCTMQQRRMIVAWLSNPSSVPAATF